VRDRLIYYSPPTSNLKHGPLQELAYLLEAMTERLANKRGDEAMRTTSKRLQKLYAGYDKPLHGSLATIEIGLPIIRQQCTRFDAWIRQMEALHKVVQP